jgi:hypothetical protein
MKEKMSWIEPKTSIFITYVMLGFVEGLLLFGLNQGLQLFWTPFIKFSSIFKSILLIQETLLFSLIFLGFGYLSVQMTTSEITNRHYKKTAGVITGIVAGFLYTIFTDYYKAVTELIGFQYYQQYVVPDDPFHLKFYVSFLSSYEIVPFLIIMILFSIIIHTLGAILFSKVTSESERYPVEKKQVDSRSRKQSKAFLVFFCLGIIILLIFPGMSYAGIMAGIIEHPYQCELCLQIDAVSVERSGTDSLGITLQTEDPSTDWIPLEKRPVFTIFINGRDVSNATIIQKQGLAMSITPHDGLQYKKGSHVVIEGSDFFNNNSSPEVKIIEIFSPDHTTLIYDKKIVS